MTFTPLDYSILGAYAVTLLTVGYIFRLKGREASASHLLMGARALTLPSLMMSLAATWYGGILGVGEFTYLYGISNWVSQALPYYIFATLFAWLWVPKIWASPALSLSEHLTQTFSGRVGRLGALLIFLLSSPAPYLLIVGVLLKLWLGLPLWLGTGLALLLVLVNVARGGLRVDVKTDQIDFVLMYVGFALLLGACLINLGSPTVMWKQLPPMHRVWHGGQSAGFVAVWFVMALWTFIDPSFFQRCKAAASPKVARQGILGAVACWFVFDMLTLMVGLYARVALPDLAQPMESFPRLGDLLLGSGVKGLFFVSMLATVLSTLNSMLLVSSQALARDGMGRQSLTALQWGLGGSALLAWLLAILLPSVVQLWFGLSSVAVPALIVAATYAYFFPSAITSRQLSGVMALGLGVSTIWLALGWWHQPGAFDTFPLGLQPMFAGLLASGISGLWLSRYGRPSQASSEILPSPRAYGKKRQ